MDALAALAQARFVPVVRAPSADLAVRAGRALVRGGCRVVEVTFTTPGAEMAIARLVADGIATGAGTVLDAATARRALDAGATFLVSPHLAPEVLAAAADRGVLAIPGALTPTEILAAQAAGAEVVKIFPAEAVGGPRYLKLVGDPLPGIRFFPTGGVTLENAQDYLAAGAIAVGVASSLAPQALIAAGDEAALEAAARRWTAALATPTGPPGRGRGGPCSEPWESG